MHNNLRIKSFISHKLTKRLVDEDVIINNFAQNGVSKLLDIETHVINYFKNKEVTFLLWCKPYKDEENDSFVISKGNLTDVGIADNVVFPKWGFAVEQNVTIRTNNEQKEDDQSSET